VAPKRKLFLTHSGELAHRLICDVQRDGLVARFVHSYADRHDRQGLLSDRARLPELESTIGREALLVMAAEVPRLLPRAFAPGPKGALRPDDANFIEAFYAEFLLSLGRGLEWPPAEAAREAETFRRDLAMYRQWGQRPGQVAGDAHAGETPFRDRCALLLDPSMMEQARRGAAEFEQEILRTAARRLNQLGQPERFASSTPRRRAAKSRHANAKKKPASRIAKPTHRKQRKPSSRRRPSRAR
jgi:hypothetical protein